MFYIILLWEVSILIVLCFPGEKMSKILVIDDDKEVRDIITISLECVGHSISQAEDGLVGFKMLDGNDFDLIITDLVMPHQDGVETIIQIKSQYPDLKIIVISGKTRINSSSYSILEDTFKVDKSLFKPIDFAELVKSVNELLD